MGGAAPLGFSTNLKGAAVEQVMKRLTALNAVGAGSLWHGITGVDTQPLVQAGVPGFSLQPDPRHYFDYHHSAADTLDKIDATELAQCSAAVAALAWILSETSEPIG